MPGTLYNADNVVVGNAVLWHKPWSATTPATIIADATPLFDVDAYEAAGWVGAGATNEGFTANVESSTTTVTIEEQTTPVGESIESKNINFEAALAEDTLETISLSWGGGAITITPAGAGQPGKKSMNLSDALIYKAVILEMRNFSGFARRIFVPKMSVTGSGETSFRRAADKRLYPVRFASLSSPTEIQVVDITAAATA